MAIIGFVLSLCLLSYITFAILFCGLHGGEEFSPIGVREMWWYLPLCCFLVYLWTLLFTYSPFSITITA